MAGWQFRCVCCGELRAAPMARPEGTVYLRCVASREWAWYEPSAFIAITESAPALGDGGDRAKSPRPAARRARPAARATRTAAGRGKAAPARGARGGAGRKGVKRARKRR